MATEKKNKSDPNGDSNDKPAYSENGYDSFLLPTKMFGANVSVILFSADAVTSKGCIGMRHLGEKFHLAYKLVNTECKIVKSILSAYGFQEVHPCSPDFNLTWTNSHIKPGTLNSMTEFQKINHFPRSFELTRKDRLYKNIQHMQLNKAAKCLDFIPQSFLIPMEFADFCNEFKKWKGLWIVKPLALSRGRGIYVVSRPDDLSIDEPVLVAKYIDNPFLINGYKFDLRLYVAVTSFDPLVLYLFKEGLARFATEKYRNGIKHLGNQCMHLTNYSVNRHSANYVRCYDPDVEDYGNKWSLSALMSFLQSRGFNTTTLYTQIKDIVIKAVVSAELPITTACRVEAFKRGNCFELFGFDILLDETLKPWLLEVNFSPSLACDLPLDLKIKSKVVADLFTLTGVVAHDPLLLRFQQKRSNSRLPQKAAANKDVQDSELKMLKMVQDEIDRQGDFVRIFPTANTWELYGHLFESRQTYNAILHKLLFPSICKFTLTDFCKGPKTALYTCIKANKSECKNHEKLSPKKFELAKKFVSTTLGRFNSSAVKSKKPTDYIHLSQMQKNTSIINTITIGIDENTMIALLKMDETLSQVQARQVFALYLKKVGEKLETIMKGETAENSRQSSHHFKQQLELVLQFLEYASGNLASPIVIMRPSVSKTIGVQGSQVLEQIDRFLEIYERETDSMCWRSTASGDREYFVRQDVFDKFIKTAKASELEEVLMIVAEHHSTSWFLGTQRQNRAHSETSRHRTDVDQDNNHVCLCNFHHFFLQQSLSTNDCSRSGSLYRRHPSMMHHLSSEDVSTGGRVSKRRVTTEDKLSRSSIQCNLYRTSRINSSRNINV